MINLLRNIAVRLLLATALGIPLSFVFISRLNKVVTEINAPLTLCGIIVFLFIIIGFLMNLTGKMAVRRYIREAAQWERAGAPEKSEEKYAKAINIFDSYLLGPWAGRKIATELTGAITRFSLAFSNRSFSFEKAATTFLKNSPHEKELIFLWLNKVLKMEKPGSGDHCLLTHLSETISPNNIRLMPLMAKIFMKTGRTDFAAQKIFSALRSNPRIHPKFRGTLNAFAENQKQLQKTVNGTPSLLTFKAARDKKTTRIFRGSIRKIGDNIAMMPVRAVFSILYVLKQIKELAGWAFHFIQISQAARKIIKWGLVSILCSGFLFLMTNTIVHLSSTAKPSNIIEKKIEVKAVQKPFTIQVAAYLKKKHADKYAASLKEKGLEAYITRTEGGGKTWHLVRISHFDSKKNAADFGQDLKDKEIIDDFFVDNSGRAGGK